MTKDKDFWDSCARAVNNVCQSNRTGLWIIEFRFAIHFILVCLSHIPQFLKCM
jgi:hypothetical protein